MVKEVLAVSRSLGRTIMVQGTSSSVGKSVLCTALCRIFRQDGYTVAPFKSQNMSLYSYVVKGGGEISRSQSVQAEAARIEPTVDMNPILLRPRKDSVSQVIARGKPVGDMTAHQYRADYVPIAFDIVKESLGRLRQYEVVVIEGAGSPVEVNLKDREIVNMRVARIAASPVLLVADINLGGVFASLIGTLDLLEPWERDLVVGLVINKFRGSRALFEPGIDFLEKRTGKPVLGVLPYIHDLQIPEEDSASEGASTGRLSPGGDLRQDTNTVADDTEAFAASRERREAAYDRLAAEVRANLDMERVYMTF